MGNRPSSQCKQHKSELKLQTLFKSKTGEVYRIPALFYDEENETLWAFAEKRTSKDDASTVAIVMRTGKLNRDKTTHTVTNIEWSDPSDVVQKDSGLRPMNPCPVYDKINKRLFLFFIRVKGSECWQRFWGCNMAHLCYVTKDPDGSWSDETDLTDKLPEIQNWATFAVGPGHGTQTQNNRLIVPVYAYASSSCKMFYCSTPFALSLYSSDSGKNWQFGTMLEHKSVECEMAEFSDNQIYCNARNEGGYRVEAVSDDDGSTFKVLQAEILPETSTGCQGSVVSFPQQTETPSNDQDSNLKWLLFTHPTKTERRDLGVYVNKTPQDPNGWSKPLIINNGPSGYSDVAYLDDGYFACLMERGDQKETEEIALMIFSYKQVSLQTMQSEFLFC